MRTEAAGCAGELHMKAPARYAQPRSERRELLLLHIRILFASVHLGFGLLLAALLGLVAAASAGLTRGTSGRSLRL